MLSISLNSLKILLCMADKDKSGSLSREELDEFALTGSASGDVATTLAQLLEHFVEFAGDDKLVTESDYGKTPDPGLFDQKA